MKTINIQDMVGDVETFAKKFGLSYDGGPRALPQEIEHFRIEFMNEELSEYVKATIGIYQLDLFATGSPARQLIQQKADQLDALVDLIYVAIGTALLHGYDLREAWSRVHRANMQKVLASQSHQSKRGYSLDVVKPPGWVAPDHTDLVDGL